MTIMDLYLVTDNKIQVAVFKAKGGTVFRGMIENCEQEHLDMVIKDIAPLGYNTFLITVL